jgi:hypothetical protein
VRYRELDILEIFWEFLGNSLREADTKICSVIFQNFYFLMIKFTIIKKGPFGKIGVLVNSIIQELNFSKLLSFFVSVSSVIEKYERMERIIFSQDPNLDNIFITAFFK